MKCRNMLVSVVLLSWNRKQEIVQTLEDLDRQTYKNIEIIVVDQGSDDGTPDEIERKFPRVKLIRLHKNVGIPGGRNIGMANAKGEVVVILDNDASLNESGIEKAVRRFQEEKKLGIIAFKILVDRTRELDLSTWVFQKSKIPDADKEFYTYTYCGCGHAIKREVFEKVGYYWDELFFSWEEMELSLRILDHGFDILYMPDVEVYHRISPENRTFNCAHECLRLRNSLWVLWRYMPLRYSLGESLLRIPAYFVKAARQKCFFRMLVYFLASFKKSYFVFSPKEKIAKNTAKKYRKLSYKGSFSQKVKELFRTTPP
jgi:GT2 family glycosyltransferase